MPQTVRSRCKSPLGARHQRLLRRKKGCLHSRLSPLGLCHSNPNHWDLATLQSYQHLLGRSSSRHGAKGSLLQTEDLAGTQASQDVSSSLHQHAWAAAWESLTPPSLPVDRGKAKNRWSTGKDGTISGKRLAANETLVSKPIIALQGLAAGPRAQLLALSLLALELQLTSLTGDVRNASAEDWKVLMPALLASCSLTAAQGFLGYTPLVLKKRATQTRKLLSARQGVCQDLSKLDGPLQHRQLDNGSGQTEVNLKRQDDLGRAMEDIPPNELADESSRLAQSRASRKGAVEDGQAEEQGPREKYEMYAIVLCHLIQQASLDPTNATYSPRPAGDRSHVSKDVAASESTEQSRHAPPRKEQWSWQRVMRFFSKPSVGSRPARARQKPQEKAAARSLSTHMEGPRSSAYQTRAATLQLLKSQQPGVRGWGCRTGLPGGAGQVGLAKHAAVVLEDLAFQVADSVAAAYLAEAAAGLSGGPAQVKSPSLKERAWPTFLHAKLQHTRALERFRNQLAFQQFVEKRWTAVVAIYEDKHYLWGSGPSGQLLRRSIPMRRAQELKALKGTRAAISYILEFLDFATPLVQKVGSKAVRAASWLLVFMIGRSLGLVCKGIRQSLGMRGAPKPKSSNDDDSRTVFA